jgi:hypothetical protein
MLFFMLINKYILIFSLHVVINIYFCLIASHRKCWERRRGETSIFMFYVCLFILAD